MTRFGVTPRSHFTAAFSLCIIIITVNSLDPFFFVHFQSCLPQFALLLLSSRVFRKGNGNEVMISRCFLFCLDRLLVYTNRS